MYEWKYDILFEYVALYYCTWKAWKMEEKIWENKHGKNSEREKSDGRMHERMHEIKNKKMKESEE